MRRVWATADWIGTGTDDDPFRPDVDGIGALGWVGYQLNDNRALVYAVVPDEMTDSELTRVRVRVVHGEDEQDARGRRERIPEQAREAIEQELRSFDRRGVDYAAMNVNPRGAVERG